LQTPSLAGQKVLMLSLGRPFTDAPLNGSPKVTTP
jgi:hypothetical protein